VGGRRSGNLLGDQTIRAMAEAMCADVPASGGAEGMKARRRVLTSNLLPPELNLLGPDALAGVHAMLPVTLQRLDLGLNNLNDGGLIILSRLLEGGAWSRLAHLGVHFNDFGPRGLAALAQAMKEGHLL